MSCCCGTAGRAPRLRAVPGLPFLAAPPGPGRGRTCVAELLAGVDEPTLVAPEARGRMPVRSLDVTVGLPEDLTTRLAAVARANELTMNTLVQGAWAMMLGRLTGRTDVVFGTSCPGARRRSPAWRRCSACSWPPCRCGSGSNPPPRSSRSSPACRTSSPGWPRSPTSGWPTSSGRPACPSCSTLTVFASQPGNDELSSAGLRVTGVDELDAIHYPLGLAATPGPRLALRVCYRPDLYTADDAERVAARLVSLFEAVAADPSAPQGGLDVLSGEERRLVLHDWKSTGPAVPPVTLPDLVQAQVRRTPAAEAVHLRRHRPELRRAQRRGQRLAEPTA